MAQFPDVDQLPRMSFRGASRVPASMIRKTSASKLAEHRDYARFAQYFLGQAPATVADALSFLLSRSRDRHHGNDSFHENRAGRRRGL